MALTLWVSPADLDASTPEDAHEAARTATLIVWALSGRRYGGQRRVTERYECECSGVSRIARTPSGPVLVDGAVVNVSLACGCGGSKAHQRLRLRGQPVRTINRVSRGGVPLGASEWTLSQNSVLELASGEVCGLEVDYTYGSNPPAAGRRAAQKLAQELLLGWSGDDSCALPDRVTNVSREGISFTVMDKQEFLDDLRTGIYEVDLFLRVVNPDRARNKAKVFNPGAPKAMGLPPGQPTPVPVVDAQYSLAIRQGAYLLREFSRTVDGTPEPLTEYSFASQVRSFEAPEATLLLDLGPYLSVPADNPTILRLYVPADITAGLPAFPSTAAWDLHIWPTADPAARQVWLEGPAYLELTTTVVTL